MPIGFECSQRGIGNRCQMQVYGLAQVIEYFQGVADDQPGRYDEAAVLTTAETFNNEGCDQLGSCILSRVAIERSRQLLIGTDDTDVSKDAGYLRKYALHPGAGCKEPPCIEGDGEICAPNAGGVVVCVNAERSGMQGGSNG